MRIRTIVLASSLAATMFAAFVACTGDEASTNSNAVDSGTDSKVSTTDGTAPNGNDGSVGVTDSGTDAGTDGTVGPTDAGMDASPTTLLGTRLVLWLVADKGFDVDAGLANTLIWRDQSGYGHDALQGNTNDQPVFFDGGSGGINGHGVVHFDGVTQHIGVPDDVAFQWASSDYTVFVVERHTNTTASYALLYAKFTNSGNFPGPILWADYPTTTGFATRIAFDGQEVFSDAGYNDDVMRVVGTRRVGSDLQLHINGTMVADNPNTNISDEAGFNAVGNPVNLGGRSDYIQMLSGDIAEVVAVKGVVTDPEIAQLQAYLKAKYGL